MTESYVKVGVNGGNVYLIVNDDEPQIMSSRNARLLAKLLVESADQANKDLPQVEESPWKPILFVVGAFLIFISRI